MTDLIVRPLVAGEEHLFDAMPDPFPQLRQVSYAAGVAGGGFRPEHTWIAMRDGEVVARAAWLQPPGAVGRPWLERFDLRAEPEIGAALLRAAHEALGGATSYYAAMPAGWQDQPHLRSVVEPPMRAARLAGLAESVERLRFSWTELPVPESSGQYSFRPAASIEEINELVARVAVPAVLTGAETAMLMRGVDLARQPLDWLSGTLSDWRLALDGNRPVGLAGATENACYPMLAYVGMTDDAVRGELIADAVRTLVHAGAEEIVADVDADRAAVIADLERAGLTAVRSRVLFTPAGS